MAEDGRAGLRYKAFISYSHEDDAEAARIHRRLESYRLPRRLVGRPTPYGPLPSRLWPIFRDREEMAASTDLSEAVRAALDRSGALIVLCSPAAARSRWVGEEIATFLALHPDRPVLAAIIGGEPPDCFPEALRTRGGDGICYEPLATDLRPGGDGPQLGLLKLVAGLTGVGLDDIVQRDAHRRIRRVTAVTGVAVAAMLIMAAMTVYALEGRRNADRQRAEAEGLVEFMLSDLRQSLKAVGRLDIMGDVNRRALEYYEHQGPLKNLPDESLERRARILGAMGEDDENRGEYERARQRYEALHSTTAALLAKSPADAERVLAHARSENRLGLLAITRNQHAEAWRRLARTRSLLASVAAWGEMRPDWLRLAGYAEGNSCATILRGGGEPARAIGHCRRAVVHNERLAALQPADATASYDLVFHLSELAEAQHASGEREAARLTQQRYLALMDRLVAREPDNMLWREQQMELYVRHARFLRIQGEPDEARRYRAEALAISRRLVARDPRNARWADFQRRLSQPRTEEQPR
jgi:tetratricopeptide (TPR) repeat protein